MKWFAAFGVVLCLVAFLGRPARAEAPRLALVLAPRSDDPALVEVTARVRGELSAAGFRVLTRDAPFGVSAERAVAETGAELGPSAVLSIVTAPGHSSSAPKLEIWLSDRLLGKVSMARLKGGADKVQTPKVLAVEAVELLRARISELRVEPSDKPSEAIAASESAGWVEQPRGAAQPGHASDSNDAAPDLSAAADPKRTPWLGASLGLGYLFGSGSLSGSLLPVLGLHVGLAEPAAGAVPLSCDFRLSAGGFGQGERVRELRGSARVDQAFGAVHAALRVVTGVPVEPFVGLGAGVYTLGVRGQAESPYVAHATRYWTPLAAATLGVRSRPFAHLSLLASGELLFAFSRAEVHVADARVARAGGAMWLLRAELMGVF